MRLWKWVSITLFLLLIGAILFNLYLVLDHASLNKYRDQVLYENRETLRSLKAIMPLLASEKSKEDIIELVEGELQEEGYEKEGVNRIGWVGLVFDDEGKLIKVLENDEHWEEGL